MNSSEKFQQIYGREAQGSVFCPYRVCPIGAHSDHQAGKITGFAIDKGITISFSPKQNGVVELCSLQFEKRAQWHISNVPSVKQNDWADYLRGVTIELSRIRPLHTGLSGVIEGSLPIGGLSSSAAVCIAFLGALCSVNGISLSPAEIISVSKASENDYVGVNCGKLDQSCEVYCRQDNLLYLDTLDDTFELIPTAPTSKPYKIGIFFSGVERSLAGSAFNARVDECRSAAYALKAFAGLPYERFPQTNLRDVPREVYDEYKERLPEPWRRRAEHWYTEYDRVERGAKAWRKGDIGEFGRLVFESGHSSIYNWETGSDELKAIYEIMTRTDGIYGGRFSGAGFKGCCMALIDPDFEESIDRTVRTEYLKLFPTLKDKYSSYFCYSASGVSF